MVHLSGGDEAREHTDRIERTLRRVAPSAQVARVVPMMMAAASTYRTGVPQVIIVGARDATATVALHRVLTACFLPGAVSLVVEPGAHQTAIVERLPWVGALEMRDRLPTAYLCRDFACQAPVTDPAAFRAQLEAVGSHR